MEILLWFFVFVISLIVLLESCDYFTDSAETLGLFFKLPAFVVGVTIVAVGTSLPELVFSVFSMVNGSSEIVAGSVFGSNIANILLVLGLVGVVGKKVRFDYEIINVDLPLLLGSALLLMFIVLDGQINLFESILCIVGVVIFISHTITLKKKINKKEEAELEQDLKEEFNLEKRIKDFPLKSLAVLLMSSFFIFLSAKYSVDAILKLSELLNIAKEVISASMVAIGTSFPELVISLNSIKSKKPEIAIGNVLGSNVFNSLGVVGIAGLFGTIFVPSSIILFALPVMISATFLYVFATQDKEITRWEGSFLIILYVFFIVRFLGWA